MNSIIVNNCQDILTADPLTCVCVCVCVCCATLPEFLTSWLLCRWHWWQAPWVWTRTSARCDTIVGCRSGSSRWRCTRWCRTAATKWACISWFSRVVSGRASSSTHTPRQCSRRRRRRGSFHRRSPSWCASRGSLCRRCPGPPWSSPDDFARSQLTKEIPTRQSSLQRAFGGHR